MFRVIQVRLVGRVIVPASTREAGVRSDLRVDLVATFPCLA
jgi:hypothetical protein